MATSVFCKIAILATVWGYITSAVQAFTATGQNAVQRVPFVRRPALADTSVLTDFKIYQAEFQAGVWEGITQAVQAFNGASRNAIRLVTQALEGQYSKEAFFTDVSGLISRRDVTSVATAAGLKLTQDEVISVKVNRKIGPVETTLDAIRKISGSQQEISFMLGRMIGEKKMQDYLNTGILACSAALEGQSAIIYDATGQSTKTMTTAHLVSGLAKFGDMAERIVAWVMHSKVYFDLVQEQIAAKITNVADRVVYGASPATLNRPVIISDIPSLHEANGSATDTYNTLGLVSDACVVTESEQSDIITEIVTGLENLVMRMQGEFAFNLKTRGFKWDITSGGQNPNDAALGLSTNWDKVATENKDLAGVLINSQ